MQQQNPPTSPAPDVVSQMTATPQPCQQSSGEKKKDVPGAATVVNNFYNFDNCPIHLGPSFGNTANYNGPRVRLKISGPPELLDELSRKLGDDNSQMSLKDVINECDSDLVGIRKGCVELTLRVRSLEGLEKLWKMYSSRELQQRLQSDLPVNSVQISVEDLTEARLFFEKAKQKAVLKLNKEVNRFELATTRYVRCRKKTVALLRNLVDYINRRQRIAQAATVAGTAGFVLALFTLGTSLALPAAGAGAVTVIGAIVVQGITAKISADSAKEAMEDDKQACSEVQAALAKVDSKLKEWKEVEERVLIDSIYDLVRVDMMDLQGGEEVFETMGRHGEGIIQFVIITISLETILVHVLDIFRKEISKMAQKIAELAVKLDCPQEEPMRQLVSKIRRRLQAFGAI